MKIKNILFRLAAVLTAFMLGVGFFNAAQYGQMFFTTREATAIKQEALSVPPRPVPTVIFAAPETAAYSEEETETEFDAGDMYYIIGNLSKQFKDFDNLVVTTRDYRNSSEKNDFRGDPIPPKGYVLTKEVKKIKFARINIANRQISFETEAIAGISYRFVGKFIDKHPIIGVYTSYPVLKGQLVKMRDGKMIAVSAVKLGRVGGC
ncbi:MAG TPA: hypothetical protein VF599_06265 [Pyrinomonadaceae bacterium]|jgi:hypothetical protein